MLIKRLTIISAILALLFFAIGCSDDDDNGGGSSTNTVEFNGYLYRTVHIGTQVWFAENLRTTAYSDGSEIPYLPEDRDWRNVDEEGAYCYYEGNITNEVSYGLLYNWYAYTDPRGICPDGWRVPDDNDWLILIDYLGGIDEAGGRMKEAGFAHWSAPNEGATNESGFTALPGGYRDHLGVYRSINTYAGFWTLIEGSSVAWHRSLIHFRSSVGRHSYGYWKACGFSVRCVKD